MNHSAQRQLYNAQARLDLWESLKDEHHPLNTAWPRFLDQDPTQQHFAERILHYRGLRRFQFAIVERDPATGAEIMIACARSIPFFWPELEEIKHRDGGVLSSHPSVLCSLPDGGWDTIVSRGIQQYCSREGISTISPIFTRNQEQDTHICAMNQRPNALSALSITIREDRRMLGLAERLLEAMKQAAKDAHLRVLVVPLRPTRKSEVPYVPMEEYITWSQDPKFLPKDTTALPLQRSSHSRRSSNQEKCNSSGQKLPYDPWLRKHILLGGRIAQIAQSSMTVKGTFEEWQGWTGIDFHRVSQNRQDRSMENNLGCKHSYFEIAVPGGVVPLKVFPAQKICKYVEPNVWLYHELQ